MHNRWVRSAEMEQIIELLFADQRSSDPATKTIQERRARLDGLANVFPVPDDIESSELDLGGVPTVRLDPPGSGRRRPPLYPRRRVRRRLGPVPQRDGGQVRTGRGGGRLPARVPAGARAPISGSARRRGRCVPCASRRGEWRRHPDRPRWRLGRWGPCRRALRVPARRRRAAAARDGPALALARPDLHESVLGCAV